MTSETTPEHSQNSQAEPSYSLSETPSVRRPVVRQPRTRTVDTPLSECPTNLDLRRADHRAWAFNAGNPADLRLNGAIPLRLRVVAYLILPDQREDPETGEIREFERLVLFTKKGETFKTSSAFGWHRAKAAVELFSEDEWEQGIPFVIRARQSEQKRWYHDIRIALDNEDDPATPE